jgi:hypothetical protein
MNKSTKQLITSNNIEYSFIPEPADMFAFCARLKMNSKICHVGLKINNIKLRLTIKAKLGENSPITLIN